MTLPQIEINFKQRAATAIQRSSKGIVAMVVTDSNYSQNGGKHEYTSALNVTGLDAANIKLVKQCFLGAPVKVIVIVVETAFEEAVDILNSIEFNWLVCNIVADQADIKAYASEKYAAKLFGTVLYNTGAASDLRQVVDFPNTSVTLADGSTQAGSDYIIRIAGLLAGLPFTRSATYYVLTDLKSVTEVETIAAGQFALINDSGDVRVARAVNSLTTLSENITADFQKITIFEGQTLITKDIRAEFKNSYIGKYKNKYDNQALFMSAVRVGYFRELAKIDVFDENYYNTCDVDIAEQKAAWIASGKDADEVNAWNEIKTKLNTFKTWMYQLCDVKMLDAIEDMKFNVAMF